MNGPLELVLSRLESVRRSGDQHSARCPVHGDRRPSLTVGIGQQGQVLLKCHAGCSLGAILEQLRLELRDLWPRDNSDGSREQHGRIVATYDYHDEGGTLLFQVVRFEPKDFRQRRPDGQGGWAWNLKGVRCVPYRLRELLAAAPDSWVWIVEGEKDADNLTALGLVATTNAGGAGKWRAEYNAHLRARHVAIIPDADDHGKNHANDVARSLLGVAHDVRIVRLPGLPEHGDLSDWLAAGGSKEKLMELVAVAKPVIREDLEAQDPGLGLIAVGALLAEPDEAVEWVVDGLLPLGGCSVMAGKPKAGKSTTARSLACDVARGRSFLGRETEQGPVIYLALEEKRSQVRRHFRDMGATADDPIFITFDRMPQDGLKRLRRTAERHAPVLIIVDPLFKLIRAKDGNDYAELSRLFEDVIALSRDTGAHVLAVHHLGKGEQRSGIDAILGSTAITAAVDTVLILSRSERYRTVSSIQRYGEDLNEVTLNLDPQTRTVTAGPTKHEAEQVELEAAILVYLRAKAEPATSPEIFEAVPGRRTIKLRALGALVTSDRINRAGTGKKGDPFLYDAGTGKSASPEPSADCDSGILVPFKEGELGNQNLKERDFLGASRDIPSSQDTGGSDLHEPEEDTWTG